jgi:sulfur carrier protein ThiS
MFITVNINGPMRRPWKENSRRIEAPDGCTVTELLQALGYSQNDQKYLLVAINQQKSDSQTQIPDGSIVDLILLVGGG